MPRSIISLSTSTRNLDVAVNELDDCCVLMGLPQDATVNDVRVATLARLANAERVVGRQPRPDMDVTLRTQFIEHEAVRLEQLYRARRSVMGYNAQTEAIQTKMVSLLDDGAQAGRSWVRFLDIQSRLAEKLAQEPRLAELGDVFAEASDADGVQYSEALAECVTSPEAA